MHELLRKEISDSGCVRPEEHVLVTSRDELHGTPTCREPAPAIGRVSASNVGLLQRRKSVVVRRRRQCPEEEHGSPERAARLEAVNQSARFPEVIDETADEARTEHVCKHLLLGESGEKP